MVEGNLGISNFSGCSGSGGVYFPGFCVPPQVDPAGKVDLGFPTDGGGVVDLAFSPKALAGGKSASL